MFNEKSENPRRRLTPELRAIIAKAFIDGTAPPALRSAAYQPLVASFMREGAPLESTAPAATLEAIIQRFGRPPLLVRNNKVVMEPLTEFEPGTDGLIKAVEKWIPSVGRIEFVNHRMSWGGTGWVAEEKGGKVIVVTNRHVAKVVAQRRADGVAVYLRSPSGGRYGAKIDFLEEMGSGNSNAKTAELTSVRYLADDMSADVALLEISADGFLLPNPLKLSEKELAKGQRVALVGYPAYDSRNNDDDQARYFQDLYEVKRFAPGKIMQAQAGATQLTYDCTSLGGNSGSPLIDLEGGEGRVVGLHFSGLYGVENTAVSASTLQRLLDGQRPVSVLLAPPPLEAKDSHHDADFYVGRKGFDQTFLKGGAVKTPWPGLPTDLAADLAKPSDGPSEPNELRYTQFGVKYSATKKLPLVTAVNIDGGRSIRIKRGDDQWFSDGRIPRDIQLGSKNFADLQIDRGHMVRREDPNWAPSSLATAKDKLNWATTANFDTFHYVNAIAQHSTLNQGKALWQGLENYILDSARTHGLQACVFTGPVLRDGDDEDGELEIDGAVVPLEFWKLVATLDAESEALHATAYLLSQGQLIRKLMERRAQKESLEGVTLGAYRTFQVSVKDLADATGYELSAYVEADPMAKKASDEALEMAGPLFLPLEDERDLLL
jgi:endonuclease G